MKFLGTFFNIARQGLCWHFSLFLKSEETSLGFIKSDMCILVVNYLLQFRIKMYAQTGYGYGDAVQ